MWRLSFLATHDWLLPGTYRSHLPGQRNTSSSSIRPTDAIRKQSTWLISDQLSSFEIQYSIFRRQHAIMRSATLNIESFNALLIAQNLAINKILHQVLLRHIWLKNMIEIINIFDGSLLNQSQRIDFAHTLESQGWGPVENI